MSLETKKFPWLGAYAISCLINIGIYMCMGVSLIFFLKDGSLKKKSPAIKVGKRSYVC